MYAYILYHWTNAIVINAWMLVKQKSRPVERQIKNIYMIKKKEKRTTTTMKKIWTYYIDQDRRIVVLS